jgi:hypothetical protein
MHAPVVAYNYAGAQSWCRQCRKRDLFTGGTHSSGKSEPFIERHACLVVIDADCDNGET